MLHHTEISAQPSERIYLMQPSVNLAELVQQQVRKMSAQGYTDIDVRWNSTALSIAARGEASFVQRVYNSAGACVLEKVDCGGSGVERYYDADGITLLYEEIFDESEDR